MTHLPFLPPTRFPGTQKQTTPRTIFLTHTRRYQCVALISMSAYMFAALSHVFTLVDRDCVPSFVSFIVMSTNTNPQTPFPTTILSNWMGSDKTRLNVEEQIRARFGPDAAASYDPRRNCLTFNAWMKAGFRVKKGEKALQSITLIEKKNSKGEVVQRYPKKVFLFFFTQVEPISAPSSSRL